MYDANKIDLFKVTDPTSHCSIRATFLIVTLAMLLRFINCRFILLIIIIYLHEDIDVADVGTLQHVMRQLRL